MEVYEFEKCLLDRLEESLNVLSWQDELMPASQVRLEWSAFIELQIEPAGWQALWKIPRVICEEVGVRFSTFVYGIVEQVLFKELKAIFLVLAVQDNDIHLPERHEVNLQDLWPTQTQENKELNLEKTADCIDQLRFFYTNVWMPWDNDNDEDLNWVEKHLESRIRFCYDLKKKNIKPSLAAHILTLLAEAKFIQQRREYIEIGLSDDEELDDSLNKSQINNLMRLHLRLNKIKSEIEMLENPKLRKIYEEMKSEEESCCPNSEKDDSKNDTGDVGICYMVTMEYPIDQQIKFLTMVQQSISKECPVRMFSSFQHILNTSNASASIYLCPGKHAIKLFENLNNNGVIVGLNKHPANKSSQKTSNKNSVVITSLDEDSSLLIFDGDFTLINIVLDCHNVRTGIIVKQGNVTFKNCRIIGDGKSSTQQGIVCTGNSNLLLEDSCIENFSTGVIVTKNSTLTLKNSEVIRCRIGVDISENSARINLNKTKIIGSTKCGIYADNLELINTDEKQLTLSSLNQLKQYFSTEIPWTDDCIFNECASNIIIFNKKMSLIPSQILNIICKENDTHEM